MLRIVCVLKVKIVALYHKFYQQEMYRRVLYIAAIFEQMRGNDTESVGRENKTGIDRSLH